MSNAVTVVIPQNLREKAGRLGINISKVSREALADEVLKVEKGGHMNSVPVPEKTSVIDVSRREVSFFAKNYPVHHAVLLELVRRGEARITEEVKAG